jgi:hypothetical protein
MLIDKLILRLDVHVLDDLGLFCHFVHDRRVHHLVHQLLCVELYHFCRVRRHLFRVLRTAFFGPLRAGICRRANKVVLLQVHVRWGRRVIRHRFARF